MTSTLDKLRHHIQYLSDPTRSAWTSGLAEAFAAAAVPFGATGLIAPGMLAAIEVEVIYCASRHSAWLSAPLLASVVSDYLARSFHLERAVATSLTGAVLAAARRLKRQVGDALPEEDTSDEFLRCVCVATATAVDADALELDLGFGTALLGRIKQALGLVQDETHAAMGGVRFVPELDAQIAAAIAGLAAAMRQTPWALQHYRLSYLLLEQCEPWSSVVAEEGVAWLFELLMRVAEDQVVNTRQLTQHLMSLLPAQPELHDEASVTLLCQHLGARGLLARERDRSWRALPLANELTAEALAAKLATTPDELRAQLSKMASALQAAALRQIDADAEFFSHVIQEVRPLSPSGLQAASERLADLTSPGRARSVLTACLALETSFCLRRAAEAAVAKLHD